MVKLADVANTLQVAQELAAKGLQVFPARYKDKPPLVDWKKYQTTSAAPMLEKWFKDRGYLNYWVMTGRMSGYAVLDADSKAGDEWWRSHIDPDILDQTACVETSKGHHYWFKIPEDYDGPLKSWSVHPGKDDEHDISFDVRMNGTGVIVPPSVHESGHHYTWIRPLEDALPCPPGVYDGSIEKQKPLATGDAGGGIQGTGGQTRSMLSRLLERPPGGEGSGRNDWLARVAGHYAKTYHNQQDLYDAHCRQANASMGDPLDDAEYEKTVGSIWKGEHENNVYRGMDAATGHLASGGNKILCQVLVKSKDGESRDYDIVEYADFDLKAKGVMTDEAGSRTYWCEVARKRRDGTGETERFDVVLRGEVLGDDRAFRRYLARFACTIVPPENMWPRAGTPGQRFQRFLESQHPPVVEITPCLGWNDHTLDTEGAFVTHDGAITPAGHVGIESVSVRADPRLRSGGTAPFEYGFESNPVVARDTLREILSFHDEATATVFGSWWAACLLKPQIEQRTALFPFMAVEAPSESGKTNGYFAMMTQLNGNTRGETQPTKAALRDMSAANRNGIVWIDDLDDPAYLMELLRAATSGGSLTKMGEDRESVKNTEIVAPIVISGEALGLGTQKALVDRAILLKAPSPTERRSFHDPDRPQWDDILDVRESYPQGLHVLAGWLVQEALKVQDEVLLALRTGRAGGHGRAADKVAVLRAGSCLLDWLVSQEKTAWDGAGEHAVRLEKWLNGNLVDDDGKTITSNENSLTFEILPWALRTWHYPDKAYAGEKPGEPDTPAFVRKVEVDEDADRVLFGRDVEVWFRCDLLSEQWERFKGGRIEKRTTTGAALKDQAQALGCRSRQAKITNAGGRRASYWVMSGDLAKTIINRSRGK